MARLDPNPAPGDWEFPHGASSSKLDEYWRRQDEQLKKLSDASNLIPEELIHAGKVKGGLIRFPVADGYAIYLVISSSPLVLQHVPTGDAWRISDAHMRGLKLKDVQAMLLRNLAFAKIFGPGTQGA